jgi:cytochrome c553
MDIKPYHLHFQKQFLNGRQLTIDPDIGGNMKKINYVLIALLVVPFVGSASEDADSVSGKELSAYCIGCHGEFGIASISSNPNLAGQNKEYLEYALKAYRSGGLAVVMRPNAKGLSDQDIRDLASYYSNLSSK